MIKIIIKVIEFIKNQFLYKNLFYNILIIVKKIV